MLRSNSWRVFVGAQKAAIIVMALEGGRCTQLFALMADEEVRAIGSAMARLGAVCAEQAERLCADFAASVGGGGRLFGAARNLFGNLDAVEHLLMATLPEDRSARILEAIRGPADRSMWSKLDNVEESALADYLKNQAPQAVAAALSSVRPDHVTRVLARLPGSFAMDVAMRMEGVQQDVLESVERTIRGAEALADAISGAAPQPPPLTTFDDLACLAPRSVEALAHAVGKEKLPMALRGASDRIKEMFLGNLSGRAAEDLRASLDGDGAVRLREVDEAQADIVRLARQMVEQGQIELVGR
jgi:flagellar motor switch protein FliG